VQLQLFNIENLPMSFLLLFPSLLLLDIYQVSVADSPFPITLSEKQLVPRLCSLFVQTASFFTVWKLLGEGRAESSSVLDLTNSQFCCRMTMQWKSSDIY
jgi:hypothetical protein